MAKSRIFVGDFETTVYKGQAHTEVWASASVELFTEDVQIFHSIGEQLDYFISLNTNIMDLIAGILFGIRNPSLPNKLCNENSINWSLNINDLKML